MLSWRHSSCPGHGGPVINKRHLARSSSSADAPVQLHYLSDHRSGCPMLGSPEPIQFRPKAECDPGVSGFSIYKPLRSKLRWTQVIEGQGTFRQHRARAGSYLQTETRRSEVAVAKVAPGPQPPLPLHPHWPSPLSPWLPLSFPRIAPQPHTAWSAQDSLQAPHSDL